MASKISGTVVAPPSKSVTVRAIAASILSDGTSEIINPSFCDDSLACIKIAKALGAKVTTKKHSIAISGNAGLAGLVKKRVLDCGESGLCMRMFAPIAGLVEDEMTITGSGSLLKRPMEMIERLRMLGVSCITNHGYAPLVVKGPVRGGQIEIDAAITSQFLTGLLMALPLCEGDSVVVAQNLKSRPYVEMTVALLKNYGIAINVEEDYRLYRIRGGQVYVPCVYNVEGDWSGAAFLLVAGAVAGSIRVRGINPASFQADRAVADVLKKAGAVVIFGQDYVSVEKNDLKPFDFNAEDCPDLFPPLVALASCCEGKSVIYGVGRLKHKESNRAYALALEFAKLGIKIELTYDRMEIYGGKMRGNTINSHNDHRIAMACTIAALNCTGDVMIGNPECVGKSYPSFFEDIDSVKVKI